MPVPSAITGISQTPGSNSPAGSESPALLDDYIRTVFAFIATLRDGQGLSNPVDLASAATTDIGAQTSPVVRITGTTTITSFGANYAGPRFLVFAGALTLTHNATSLILPGGANITTAAGDTCVAVPNLATPTGWRVVSYQRASIPPGTALSLASSGPIGGFRNLVINGNFSVNQRSYVSGTATTGANQYTLDRWRVVTSGQSVTYSTSGNGRIATAPAGGMEQVIEGANIAGGTYVINWTGTATCTVDGVAKAKGDSFTLTAATNATVRFTSGTVSLVQIEPGTVVTTFEQRSYQIELSLCEWYYRLWEAGYSDAVATTSTRYGFTQFPEMRTTPTVVNVAAIGTQANVSSIAFNDVTARGLRMDITPTASATVLCRRSIALSAEI